ncbi:hypothetical protein ACLK19_24420 [Escherichia coli]
MLDKEAWPLMVERYVALAYDKVGDAHRTRFGAAIVMAAVAGEARCNHIPVINFRFDQNVR